MWNYIANHSEDLRNYALILVAVVGLPFAGYRLWIADQQRKLSEQGHLTQRFTDAIQLLGHTETEVRIGAIYALGRIAHDSPRDHWTIMDTLAAYIRNRSPRELRVGESVEFRPVAEGRLGVSIKQKPPPQRHSPPDVDGDATQNSPTGDIRAALGVIRNRKVSQDPPDSHLDLSFANLQRADLEKIQLPNAILTAADLRYANLAGANFAGCNLDTARMEDCILTGANLSSASLSLAQLHRVNLDCSILDGLHAFSSSFYDASMQKIVSARGADFSNCDMWRVSGGLSNFKDARFQFSKLGAADLHASNNLTEEQLRSAKLDKNTRLPDHLLHLVPTDKVDDGINFEFKDWHPNE